ncbi:MAG: sensor domain-containing diguanylate cyclase [Candidatus Omnitrophica bacterium]|nr:sensor domain-containing diguanylate cyclase [Candidatus Omnitrophota bacterium]MDD5591828.1 sensor domain-containing diguanylate cyclase [Candidatus Omnitrophota bacterium]
MEEINKIKQEIERTKTELAILYEISNAMRTTLKLDEILYIILTGVTAHIGLGFNRAILFLVNEKNSVIEGKMGIGPGDGEEANQIWTRVEREQMDLDDLINAYKVSKDILESSFNQQIRALKMPLKEQNGGLLALGVLEGMPLHLTAETIQNYSKDPIIRILKADELVVIPLKAKDKVNGIILADNFITKKPITKDDIRMLIMLANQAGLAVENSQLYEKAVIRAHTDLLTELYNHGHFQYLLSTEIEKAKASSLPLSLIMLDIDNFKVYNDALGHQAGDKILKALALLLKNQSRKMDYVCRYGGEEFTIILPQTEKKEAFLIAERLRMDIEKYTFINEEILPNKKLTVSMGLGSYPENGATASDLITSSDQALYQAKHKGKNNTCCC